MKEWAEKEVKAETHGDSVHSKSTEGVRYFKIWKRCYRSPGKWSNTNKLKRYYPL